MNNSLSETTILDLDCSICGSNLHTIINCSCHPVNRYKVLTKLSFEESQKSERIKFSRKRKKFRNIAANESGSSDNLDMRIETEDNYLEKEGFTYSSLKTSINQHDSMKLLIKKTNKRKSLLEFADRDEFYFLLCFDTMANFVKFFPQDNAIIRIPKARNKYQSMIINFALNYKEEKAKSKAKLKDIEKKLSISSSVNKGNKTPAQPKFSMFRNETASIVH